MQLVDKLFALGSLAAAVAGVSEIQASRQRWLSGAQHNYATPLFMVLVKLLRIPKFASLAISGASNWLPVASASAALVIWLIALVFSVLPPPGLRGKLSTRKLVRNHGTRQDGGGSLSSHVPE